MYNKDQEARDKQIPNTNNLKTKRFDLVDRTTAFTKNTIQYIKLLRLGAPFMTIASQVVRSAGAIGANYIEANESLGKKDFIMRMKICRKETKEARYWLELTEPIDEPGRLKKQALINEATELLKIFSSIITKVSSPF